MVIEKGVEKPHDEFLQIQRAEAIMQVPKFKRKIKKLEAELSRDPCKDATHQAIKDTCHACVATSNCLYLERNVCEKHLKLLTDAEDAARKIGEEGGRFVVESEVEVQTEVAPGLATCKDYQKTYFEQYKNKQGILMKKAQVKMNKTENQKVWEDAWEAKFGKKYSSTDSEQEEVDYRIPGKVWANQEISPIKPSDKFIDEQTARLKQSVKEKKETGGYLWTGEWIGPPMADYSNCIGFGKYSTAAQADRSLNEMYDSLDINPTSKYKSLHDSYCRPLSAGNELASPVLKTRKSFDGMQPGFLKPKEDRNVQQTRKTSIRLSSSSSSDNMEEATSTATRAAISKLAVSQTALYCTAEPTITTEPTITQTGTIPKQQQGREDKKEREPEAPKKTRVVTVSSSNEPRVVDLPEDTNYETLRMRLDKVEAEYCGWNVLDLD